MICDREFFVNDCYPREGIIDLQTLIEVEVGFTREVFQRKQVLADQRIAERLAQEGTIHNSNRNRRREDALMRMLL